MVQGMQALNYLHVKFLLWLISCFPKPEILHVNQLSGNKRAFSFRETSHIQIPPEISIRGVTFITFNFVLLPINKIKSYSA